MKLRSIYWKITLPFIVVVLLGMTVLGIYIVLTARNVQLDELRSSLINQANLVADASQADFAASNTAGLETLAKTTGRQIKARITLIYRDGTVAGDNWENPAAMENHSGRPEVRQALASGVGVSTRYSTTTRENMMYAAVPVISDGAIVGIARLALPVTTVEGMVGQGTRAIVIALLLVALLIVLLTAYITRRITSPVSQITLATEAVARGNLAQRVNVNTGDELGRLGQSFNDMAAELDRTTTLAIAGKSRLEAMLANLADGIVMTGADGRVLLANPVAEDLFGFRAGEYAGRAVIEVVHDHEIDAVYKKCIVSGKEETAEVENNGRYIRVIVSPLPADQPGGALLLFQDLTPLRNLQTMRQEFVANVSHELRTPLAGIKAMVETLQDGALEDKKVAFDFLDRVNAEVDKLTQMVSELMELSRIESGRVKLELKATDLNQLLEEGVLRFSPQAERQKLTMQTALDRALPPARVDSERLMQVINNLLHNAIKFTPAGGQITVASRFEKGRVIVSVSDTGIGIGQTDLPHIFERFYKVDRSRAGQGTGLGLAIAKHIILAHGGQIWAESQPGMGATFSFSLPPSGKI